MALPLTRLAIVTEAARRLGDTSPTFLTEVDAAFDFILSDLAGYEAIGDQRAAATSGVLVTDLREYSTQALTGLTAPYWPDRIISLRVWDFGVESLLRLVSDAEYEAQRAIDGEDKRGRPAIWRVWPNARQVQVHPPADSDSNGSAIEVVFLNKLPTIASGDPIEDIRHEDLETLVFGLQARLGPFLDETVSDPSIAWQLYLAGRDRMYARLHMRGVVQIQPADQ